MGIVFAANEESGCGVRIVDMPPQGAAASSQQLLVGDVLISINGRDCTMSNSKEVMELIGQAGEGYIDLAFQRITVPTAASAAETNNNNNNAVASTKSTEDDDNDNNNNDDDEGDDSHPEKKLMQVTNLRWQDVTSGVNGRYDGTVNQNMRPHGRGRFTSDSGQGSFEGRWEDGVVTSLDTNNNEASAASSSNNNNIAAAAAAAAIPSATNNNDTLKRRRSAYTSSDAMSCVTRMNSSSFNMADYPDAQPYPNNGQDTNTTRSTGGGGGGGGGGAPQQQLQYYCLGETQRSSQHSIQSSSIEDIIQSVYALQISDFAFVRRSNGEWSFCQLVERNNNEEGEDVMTFVVNEVGHRKSLRPERWVKMVRACSSGVTIRGGGGGGGSLLSAPFSLSRSDSMERAPSF
jgi:hypothetical protein